MPTPTAVPRAQPPRRPLKLDPKAERHFQRAVALMNAGQWAEALDPLERAIARTPRDPVFWVSLAQVQRRLGRPEASEASARRALAYDPKLQAAQRLLADVLVTQGRAPEAAHALAGVAGADDDPAVPLEAGRALLEALQFQPALEQFMRAVKIRPDLLEAHLGMAACFDWLGMPAAAGECYRTVVTLDPRQVAAWAQVVYQALHACHWDTLEADLAELHRRLPAAGADQPSPFAHVALPGATAAQHRVGAAAHFERHCRGIEPLPAVDPSARRPGRLRLGYLSNDLHDHATSRLIAGVIECHDRARVELFLYSYGIDDESVLRRRLLSAAEHWVPMRELSVARMAERIRADGIDVLVDLKGYTRGARTAVLGYRPAPVQVAWLGFPGTLGTDRVDYIVTDDVVTPPGSEADYAEHFAVMPASYQPNDRRRAVGPRPSRAECGLPATGFVFASFNNTYKITPEMFERWCRVLAAVPGAVLWLLRANRDAEAHLRDQAQRRGVDEARLVFAPNLPTPAHIARLALADAVLDSRPYNGHTTASDALWAGVPVVTCPGPTFASRVAASLLQAAGLPETIAATLDDYEAIARRLATDPDWHGALRERLRGQRDRCALFDTPRFTRDLESLYERMHARWLRGLPPARIEAQGPVGLG